MNRKAALVGCKEGSWVHTGSMSKPHLRANVRPDTILKVEVKTGDEESFEIFTGPGLYVLSRATWIRVIVVDGPHVDALCLVESAA